MDKWLLVILALALAGCSEQVTVVSIEENERCHGGESKMTTFDGPYGRFKRCGVWGKVGETFMFNRASQ